MRMWQLMGWIALAMVMAGWPQFASAQDSFEVATIKTSPPQPPGRTSVGFSVDTDRGRLSYSNVTLRDVITRAYRVAKFQVTGPDWMETGRFDIEATFASGTPEEKVPAMLQALLVERFRLTMHRESRDMPVYRLSVIPNGKKLKPTEQAGNISSNSSRTSWHVTAKTTMKEFAEFLAERVERPVIDETGLTGGYEVVMDWAPEDAAAAANDAPALPSLFTALQETLGLKLTGGRGSAEMIVVDRLERVPTEN